MTRPTTKAATTIMKPITMNGIHILLAIACMPVTLTGSCAPENSASFLLVFEIVAMLDFLPCEYLKSWD